MIFYLFIHFFFIFSSQIWYCVLYFFFFSSRRRHTRCSRDWSSDVCSSDLDGDMKHWIIRLASSEISQRSCGQGGFAHVAVSLGQFRIGLELVWRALYEFGRSEERRVGKECRCRWLTYYYRKTNEKGEELRC